MRTRGLELRDPAVVVLTLAQNLTSIASQADPVVMRRAATAALQLALLSVWMAIPTGCATVARHLPTVIAAVTDGMMVLDAIESFIDRYFKRNLDADKETKVRMALATARTALNVALRTAHGSEKLNQAQIDAAFTDFKQAYQELMTLVAPLGVSSGEKLSTRADGLQVPEPMALGLKAMR